MIAEQIYVSLSSSGHATCRGGARSREEAAETFAELGSEVAEVLTLEEYETKHPRIANWRHPFPTRDTMLDG